MRSWPRCPSIRNAAIGRGARERNDDRARPRPLSLLALLDQSFEQTPHSVEVRNTLPDEGELVFRKLARDRAILPTLEKQQFPDFLEGDDEMQPRDGRGAP